MLPETSSRRSYLTPSPRMRRRRAPSSGGTTKCTPAGNSSFGALPSRDSSLSEADAFWDRYDDETRREVNSLTVAAPWLRDANAHLTEITSRNPPETLSALLKTDTCILVLDPLRLFTPHIIEIVRAIAGKPMSLIIDGPLPGRAAPGGAMAARQRILTRLSAQWTAATDVPLPEVHFLDSEAGITAIHALRLSIDPATPAAPDFEAFQAPYLASNLGATSQNVLHALRALNTEAARSKSAEHVARQARGYVARVLAQAADEALRVRAEAEELRARAAHEAVVVGQMEARREAKVREELGRARGEVEGVLRGVRVWGPGVEGVGEAVGRVVQGRWGQGIAQQVSNARCTRDWADERTAGIRVRSTGADPRAAERGNLQASQVTRIPWLRAGAILLASPDEPTIPTRPRRTAHALGTHSAHRGTPRTTSRLERARDPAERDADDNHRVEHDVSLGVRVMDRRGAAGTDRCTDDDGARVVGRDGIPPMGRRRLGKSAACVLAGLGTC